MVRNNKSYPVLDHAWLLLQNVESRSSMISQVPDLNLQASSLTHDLKIVRLEFQSILEAFCCLSEILLLLVDAGACMPTEHTAHFTFNQR